MEINEISLILTSATAIAAVIGPVISTSINVRSNERMKKYEMYSPKIFEAVQKLTETYSKFPHPEEYQKYSDFGKTSLQNEYNATYKLFSAAAYEVMALIPSRDIHEQLISILADLGSNIWIEHAYDLKFQKLAESLALELSGQISKKQQRIARKANRHKRK